MSVSNDSLIERVQSSYRQLSVAATTLNATSDELGKSIAELDSALKMLNLGISSWVSFNKRSSPDGVCYSYNEVGYAKIDGKWGIALSSVSGDRYNPDDDNVECWLFNDAPRALRIQAVAKIPDLLEKLIKDATETTAEVKEKAEEVHRLASAISAVVDQTPKEPKRSR
jgi:methyl-accepting chemotaxis protein